MPKRELLLNELGTENDYGVLLATQMGGVPNELQLIVQTAQYDEKVEGLRVRSQYVIRVLGVREHEIHLGIFSTLAFSDAHPLLHHHNAPKVSVYFNGTPENVLELILDIQQAHLSTFGPYRHIAGDVNPAMPLMNLFERGSGLLGEMPAPLAERMVKVLKHHKLETSTVEADLPDADEHGRSREMKLLMIDNSYFIALDFSVEQMGKA